MIEDIGQNEKIHTMPMLVDTLTGIVQNPPKVRETAKRPFNRVAARARPRRWGDGPSMTGHRRSSQFDRRAMNARRRQGDRDRAHGRQTDWPSLRLASVRRNAVPASSVSSAPGDTVGRLVVTIEASATRMSAPTASRVAGRNRGARAEQRPKPRDARIQIRDMQCHRPIALRAVRMNPDFAFAKAPRMRRHVAA